MIIDETTPRSITLGWGYSPPLDPSNTVGAM